MNNELDNLIELRTRIHNDLVLANTKSHEIIANLYDSPTHFITELLQNAEDEEAKKVEFKLTEDSLTFSHDSNNLFSFRDIESISNFGDNNKKEKPNAIGRFGIGFKSVSSITNKPRIESGEFDITILNNYIPTRTENNTQFFYKGTKISLPFKEDIKQRTFELLNKEFHNFNLEYLLFLSHINSINFNSKLYEIEKDKKDKRFVTLKSETREIKYILFEKEIRIDNKKLIVKIAFLLNEKRDIISVDKSPLYVFFPTKIETNLKFLIHAPFYTTPARENIQENNSLITIENDNRNDDLRRELGKLLTESLTELRKLKMLNVELLKLLPINKNNCYRSIYYNELYNAVKKEFTDNKKLIPNNTGGFSSANELILLGSADLSELLFEKQMKKLFSRRAWVNKAITIDRAKELRDYLFTELKIPEYDLTTFANRIDESFMLEQDDSWIIKFYKIFHKTPALWKIGQKNPVLRTKPIIRVESNEKNKQVIPFQSNGKPNVFLPGKEKSDYVIVKRNIAKNSDARKFLDDFLIKEFDPIDEIHEFIIGKFNDKGSINNSDCVDAFKKIYYALQLPNQEKRTRLLSELRNCSFILGVNHETKETSRLKSADVYFPSDEMKLFFQGNTSVFFVDTEKYSILNIEIGKLQSVLKDIGIKDFPKRNIISKVLTWDEKYNLRHKSNYKHENYTYDYELDGLNYFFIQEINFEKSVTLWQILIKCCANHGKYYYSGNFFMGEYNYNFRGRDHPAPFPSFFLDQLSTKPWILIDNKLVLPSEITFSELPKKYIGYHNEEYESEDGKVENIETLNDETNHKTLAQILGFKPDAVKEFEKTNNGYKVVTKEKLDELEKYKKLYLEQNKPIPNIPANTNRETPQKPEDKGFEPQCSPDKANLNSSEYKGAEHAKPFRVGKNSNSNPNEDNPKPELPVEKLSSKELNDIGKWGQDYVKRELLNEYVGIDFEISDLNNDGEIGIGCDFMVFNIIQGNRELIKIVEVKTTKDDDEHIFWITGYQWETAREMGEYYWVYCVFNAGTPDAKIKKIQNPIKLWKDGKLFAHPVNFEIK